MAKSFTVTARHNRLKGVCVSLNSKQTLGVIYGGKSSEHEVSLRTAFSIFNAINYDQFDVIPIYIQLDGQWVKGDTYTKAPADVEHLRMSLTENISIFELAKEVDVFFPVIHGPYGEDGTLQGLLEMINVPYVGAGVLGSAMGMDKVVMKQIFSIHDLPQGDFIAVTRAQLKEDIEAVCNRIEDRLSYPNFVKPANLGSSVGISKAKDREALKEALQFAAKYDRKVIVEEFIDGREVEIGVLGNVDLQTSVVGEIIPVGEFYDYASKYKNIGTELEIPAKIPNEVAQRMTELAKKAYTALECTGLSRVDFFYDEKNDRLLLNEINTMPGFTPYSMYPMLFKEAGVSYPQLIEKLIELAVERFEEKQQNQITAESLD